MDENDLERIQFSARNARRDIHEEAHLRVRERMSADAKLNYGDAMKLVFAADPDLHKLYLDNEPARKLPNNR
jgi:hypothetical protein